MLLLLIPQCRQLQAPFPFSCNSPSCPLSLSPVSLSSVFFYLSPLFHHFLLQISFREFNFAGVFMENSSLKVLLQENFFVPCLIHASVKKNEKNLFCLECCVSCCLHCLPDHVNHRLIQIRRYVYNDVLLLGDAEKLINCSLIQNYTTNSAKVVFLKQRPVTRPLKISSNKCSLCDRHLQTPYLYCSLFCKVQSLMKTEHITKDYNLYDCTFIELPYDQLLSGRITPDSVLDSSSSSSVTGSNGGLPARFRAPEPVKKKRSNTVTIPRISIPVTWPVGLKVSAGDGMNRRKGIPRRSPLC